MKNSQIFCRRCNTEVLAQVETTSHGCFLSVILVFAIIGFFTAGIGWIVAFVAFALWILSILTDALRRYRCTRCGTLESVGATLKSAGKATAITIIVVMAVVVWCLVWGLV